MYTGSHRRSDSISLHSFQEIHRPSSTRGVPIGLGVPVFTNPGTPLSHSRVFYPRGGGGGGSNAYHGMGVSGDTPRASPCPSRPFTPQGSLRSFSGGSVETGSDVSEEVVEAVELTPQERYNLALKKALAERETLSRAKRYPVLV
ncbi:hypothetical protein BC830DRAFT_1095393 [Chytriomyces sp. MP71]|nr:hypothetical protein BC830DRAFT_1095393 [Chytriomyces sp. MP71]